MEGWYGVNIYKQNEGIKGIKEARYKARVVTQGYS